VLALALVIVLMFGLAWAIRRFGPIARARKGLGVDVIGQVTLGPRITIALVRLGSSVLLLGVTPSSVSLLKDLQASDFERELYSSKGVPDQGARG
jgi:flagellar protein FliO/FliZ